MAVYALLKQQNHDLTPAEKFGDLNICFPLGINYTDVEAIKNTVYDWLEHYDFDNDFFLPIGSPLFVAISSMVLNEIMVEKEYSSVKLLEWSKGEYIPHNVSVI